jgi:hypothetical protein
MMTVCPDRPGKKEREEMDVYCHNCGEPWDTWELHEIAQEMEVPYNTLAADFRSRGCVALGQPATTCTAHPDAGRSALIAAVYDVLGDDMDGAAAMLEDAEMAGLI